MRKLLYLFLAFLPISASGQLLQAHSDEWGNIQIDTLEETINSIEPRSTFSQLEGFPKAFVGASFKNFRNLTLADLNDDGAHEIITGINNKLYAFSAEGLLWERSLIGIATYPPTVADIDGDGQLEIAVATRGPADPGRLYLVDTEGKDLAGDWPKNFNGSWVLSAPVFSDLDGDGFMEIIATDLDRKVHLLQIDGSSYSENWPQILENTPAVTPSVGDVDGDGKKEIVVFSTQTQFVFNLDGSIADGYPISVEGLRHSYQSPILVDLNRDGELDIVSAGHGDAPEYFVRDGSGNYLEGWPQTVPMNQWTYTTPSLLEEEGSYEIFMSRRNGTEVAEMLYAWNEKGILSENFPISKVAGLEGLISIADVDDDEMPELVFGSNSFVLDTETSFLHAYEMDGSGEVAGFPIQPKGWTYMNGATIGDVNGDGSMDAVLLTYTQNFGASTDSTFIHVYDLGVPYSPRRVWWGTYKGSNSRDGNFGKVLSSNEFIQLENEVKIFPNPTREILNIERGAMRFERIVLYDLLGQERQVFDKNTATINVSKMEKGLYLLVLFTSSGQQMTKRILID
ncbi:MAG: T9SS type A sorting domain-containing protein [Bacteroidota bacterium]